MRAIRHLSSCLLILSLVLVTDRAFALDNASAVAIGPEGGWITALAVSPTYDSDGKLWAAAFGGHIFASGDAAASWSDSHTGETDPVVEGMAVSPYFAADRTVFAAADEGVFRSLDGGSTWSLDSAGLGHHFCRALAVSPSFVTDRTVWVATDGGVYRSTDGGSSWSAPIDESRPVISLAEGPAGTLYAGLDAGGLEESTDGGVHWQTVPAFPATRRVLGILSIAGTSASTVVAATDDGIWRSTDAGTTWLQVGAQGDRVDALAQNVTGASSPVLFAGSASGLGVYDSTDQGATWSRIGAPSVPFVTALAVAGASELVAGTTGGGIAVSNDAGVTWSQANHGLFASETADLRDVGGRLLVAGNGGAYAKESSTASWRRLGLPSEFVTSVDGRKSDLFAGTQDAGLMVSNDAGISWHASGLSSTDISQVALSPASSSGSALLVAGDYVYRSVDAGVSFSRSAGLAGSDVRSFAFSPNFQSDGTAFTGTINHGVYRTVDGGSTWLPASVGLPSVPITKLLTSPTFPLDDTVYAASAGSGVFVSHNGGDSWSPMAPAVPNALVGALAWTQAGQLLAGTEHGIFVLGPSEWSPIANGWDGYVTTLQDLVENGQELLYAGTTGQGVWQMTLGTVALPSSPVSTPAVATLTATSTPRPAVSPTAITKPAATAPPGVRPLVLRLRVDPVPLIAMQPALLSLKGPAGGRVQVKLVAQSWQRKFSGTLGRDGTTAFGFVSPATPITATAQVSLRGRTASAKLAIRVGGG